MRQRHMALHGRQHDDAPCASLDSHHRREAQQLIALMRGAAISGAPAYLGAWGRTWAYDSTTRRDLRLDFLRGFCLFAMIVDHIAGPSLLYGLTGGNSFYVSAAEGFVFISGLLLGMIHRKTIERHGFGTALRKALRRAGILYALMVGLTIGFYASAWLIGLPWADPEPLGGPATFVWSVLALRRAYWLTDILLLYTLLVAAAPLALWVLQHHRPGWLLAGSWLLWLLYQAAPDLLARPLPATHSFNPLAWQIFFVHALTLGYHRDRVTRYLTSARRRRLFVVSGALLLVLVLVYHGQDARFGPDAQRWLQAMTAKGDVRPGRLVAAAVVFPFAYLLATYLWWPLRRSVGWLLVPLGQRALHGYALHLLLILLSLRLAHWLATLPAPQSVRNAVVQLGAVLLVWGLVHWRAPLPRRSRGGGVARIG